MARNAQGRRRVVQTKRNRIISAQMREQLASPAPKIKRPHSRRKPSLAQRNLDMPGKELAVVRLELRRAIDEAQIVLIRIG